MTHTNAPSALPETQRIQLRNDYLQKLCELVLNFEKRSILGGYCIAEIKEEPIRLKLLPPFFFQGAGVLYDALFDFGVEIQSFLHEHNQTVERLEAVSLVIVTTTPFLEYESLASFRQTFGNEKTAYLLTPEFSPEKVLEGKIDFRFATLPVVSEQEQEMFSQSLRHFWDGLFT